MKIKSVLLLSLINFILSTTLLQVLRINGAMPNFCIIISIILLVHFDLKSAFIFAAINAILQDVFLGRILGVQVFAYLAVVLFCSYIVVQLFKGNYLTPILLFTSGTLVYHGVLFVFYFFLQMTLPLSIIGPKIAIEVGYNTIIGFMIYAFIFKRINGYKLGDYNA